VPSRVYDEQSAAHYIQGMVNRAASAGLAVGDNIGGNQDERTQPAEDVISRSLQRESTFARVSLPSELDPSLLAAFQRTAPHSRRAQRSVNI